MVVYEKIYLEANEQPIDLSKKMILYFYISYSGELIYVGIFPAYLKMALIFTDF